MPLIYLDTISFSYGSRRVLDRVSLHVGDCERAFLVGPNGSGKTTLLKIIQGDLQPDMGEVVSGVSRQFVPHPDDVDGTVADYFDAALAPLKELSIRFDQITTSLVDGGHAFESEYDQLLAEMTARDVWSLDARTSEMLAGLGLDGIGMSSNRDITSLSQGQRARLRLAALLLLRPDVLILDEPTNHLDIETIDFLTKTVKNWPGPVLIASHDRAFIEDVATVIYDMDISVWKELAIAEGMANIEGLVRNAGNYSDYLDAKETAREKYHQIHGYQQAQKRHLRQHRRESMKIASGGDRVQDPPIRMAKKFFADRAAATSVKRTRNDDERLQRLEQREVRKPRNYQLEFPAREGHLGVGVAVSVRQASAVERLAPLDLDLSRGEHLLVTGTNGSGKTTLLSWIATGEPPSGTAVSGFVSRDGSVGFVPQRLPMEGDPGLEHNVWRNGIGDLGKGILHPSMWSIPISQLSAGNQRRAQIAVALAGNPSVLIIDEPTNYLDLDTMQALELALSKWNGTLVVASHDRWLIEHWQGRRIHLQTCK
ncbi:ATP-binding cassette domain-containing protein [Arcanobacterium phocae]|uniref:Macrolide transport system ATP-binding/permease protein n=1 Tax=Arcanobacterium phocae TaxID=131112 RepID=A0A1H2LIS9_9ACTO|nr:ATP-binding cassette domain-containing protein [Arcanobacterium phocae]SDU80937.1 macrolide transport system ATP-binding/permease protein [Arcanobacterium phocae]